LAEEQTVTFSIKWIHPNGGEWGQNTGRNALSVVIIFEAM
jgi:hypothetical protein